MSPLLTLSAAVTSAKPTLAALSAAIGDSLPDTATLTEILIIEAQLKRVSALVSELRRGLADEPHRIDNLEDLLAEIETSCARKLKELADARASILEARYRAAA